MKLYKFSFGEISSVVEDVWTNEFIVRVRIHCVKRIETIFAFLLETFKSTKFTHNVWRKPNSTNTVPGVIQALRHRCWSELLLMNENRNAYKLNGYGRSDCCCCHFLWLHWNSHFLRRFIETCMNRAQYTEHSLARKQKENGKEIAQLISISFKCCEIDHGLAIVFF